MRKQLRRYPKITWTREDENSRKERMKIYYDLIQYNYPEIARRIIELNDHKGFLTITINNKTGWIPLLTKEIWEDILKHVWEHSFNESFMQIIYDEGINTGTP